MAAGEQSRPAESMVENNRRWSRYQVDLRVKVLTGVATMNRDYFGRGSDISEGGMRVFVPAELAIGDAITIELPLPYSEQKLAIRGVVRNRLGFSYGIEYACTTTAIEREQIARTCKALALLQT